MSTHHKQLIPPPEQILKSTIFTKNKFLKTSSNSENFYDYPHPPQDQSENYPFFQQNRNKQQTLFYHPNYLSSDDDDYYQPDILEPYTQEYRVQKPRQNQASQNINFYPQNSANIQNRQTIAHAKPN